MNLNQVYVAAEMMAGCKVYFWSGGAGFVKGWWGSNVSQNSRHKIIVILHVIIPQRYLCTVVNLEYISPPSILS